MRDSKSILSFIDTTTNGVVSNTISYTNPSYTQSTHNVFKGNDNKTLIVSDQKNHSPFFVTGTSDTTFKDTFNLFNNKEHQERLQFLHSTHWPYLTNCSYSHTDSSHSIEMHHIMEHTPWTLPTVRQASIINDQLPSKTIITLNKNHLEEDNITLSNIDNTLLNGESLIKGNELYPENRITTTSNVNSIQTEEWQTQFFKTKLCPYHVEGRCINGISCRFAHTSDEVRPLPDLHRTKLCDSYVRKEPCVEINCPFAHSPCELRTSSHSFYKVTLCNFYKKGRCWNGIHCRFAHGISELQGGPILSNHVDKNDISHKLNSKKIDNCPMSTNSSTYLSSDSPLNETIDNKLNDRPCYLANHVLLSPLSSLQPFWLEQLGTTTTTKTTSSSSSLSSPSFSSASVSKDITILDSTPITATSSSTLFGNQFIQPLNHYATTNDNNNNNNMYDSNDTGPECCCRTDESQRQHKSFTLQESLLNTDSSTILKDNHMTDSLLKSTYQSLQTSPYASSFPSTSSLKEESFNPSFLSIGQHDFQELTAALLFLLQHTDGIPVSQCITDDKKKIGTSHISPLHISSPSHHDLLDTDHHSKTHLTTEFKTLCGCPSTSNQWIPHELNHPANMTDITCSSIEVDKSFTYIPPYLDLSCLDNSSHSQQSHDQSVCRNTDDAYKTIINDVPFGTEMSISMTNKPIDHPYVIHDHNDHLSSSSSVCETTLSSHNQSTDIVQELTKITFKELLHLPTTNPHEDSILNNSQTLLLSIDTVNTNVNDDPHLYQSIESGNNDSMSGPFKTSHVCQTPRGKLSKISSLKDNLINESNNHVIITSFPDIIQPFMNHSFKTTCSLQEHHHTQDDSHNGLLHQHALTPPPYSNDSHQESDNLSNRMMSGLTTPEAIIPLHHMESLKSSSVSLHRSSKWNLP